MVKAAGGPTRKVLRQLEKARVAQQKAERKVGKLRARLETAETRLSKRVQRLTTLQGRMAPPAPARPPKAGGRRAHTRKSLATPLATTAAPSDETALEIEPALPGAVEGTLDEQAAPNGTAPARATRSHAPAVGDEDDAS